MVLSHSPQPFDQQALTVRLHFDLSGAKKYSLAPLHWLQMLAFEYSFRTFTFGPGSSPFFAMPYLAVGGVGPWAWVGARNFSISLPAITPFLSELQHPKSRTRFLPTWDFLLTMKPDLIAR